MEHSIHCGTSGWAYDDWRGPFYPPNTPPRDYLSRYAEAFDVVEVDSTYYRVPTAEMVAGWQARTPARFGFALKMPRVITHEKVLRDCEAEMAAFRAALAPLAGKLMCVLLQFGYFNRRAFTNAGPFLDRLSAFLKHYAGELPFACEIRNRAWLNAHYFDLLRAHGVSAALVEHAWLPPVNALLEQFDVVTGRFSYFRLIGDRVEIEKTTQKWDRVVVDRQQDLRRVAGAVREAAKRATVLVFVNNHYAGHGPQTCRELQAELNA